MEPNPFDPRFNFRLHIRALRPEWSDYKAEILRTTNSGHELLFVADRVLGRDKMLSLGEKSIIIRRR
jgi:hypothetical protein